MKTIFRNIVLGVLSLFCLPLFAKGIDVHSGYVRETIPGSQVSAAYFIIENNAVNDARLVNITSNISDRIELHEHSMIDGLMKMRQVQAIDIPQKTQVNLQPYGHHVMIFDLKSPLKHGERVEFTLYFKHRPPYKIVLPVESIKKQQHKHHH